MKKKAFTLVELLAVIVILAIILIIAVPKIMEVIKSSRTGAIESSVKLIANDISKKYEVSLANGESETLSLTGDCMELENLDYKEYSVCLYEIDDKGKVSVTLIGADGSKFDGYSTIYTNGEASTSNDTAISFIKNLEGSNVKKYMYDKDRNVVNSISNAVYTDYRFVGSNSTVNNYVYFNCQDYSDNTTCELWRIIGIVDGNVKLVRNDSIGNYSWDTSTNADPYTKNVFGVNEWGGSGDYAGAKLKQELNTLYYNGESGICYNNNPETQVTCNFSSSSSIHGFNDATRNMVLSNAIWYTGAYPYTDPEISVSDLYKVERTDTTGGGLCTTANKAECTDTVSRTTKWTGAVALINLSDYVYAGGCDSIDSNHYTGLCNKDNNWLFNSAKQWSLTPSSATWRNRMVWYINNDSVTYGDGSTHSAERGVRPTVYLKPSVKISSGTGTSTDPYTLSIN